MSWYYPYSVWAGQYQYWLPPLPDPLYLMATAFQWMIIPYYYSLILQAYRLVIDTWMKSFEKLAQVKQQ